MGKIPKLDGKTLGIIGKKFYIDKLFREMEDVERIIKAIGPGLHNETSRMFHNRLSTITQEIQRLAREWGM